MIIGVTSYPSFDLVRYLLIIKRESVTKSPFTSTGSLGLKGSRRGIFRKTLNHVPV